MSRITQKYLLGQGGAATLVGTGVTANNLMSTGYLRFAIGRTRHPHIRRDHSQRAHLTLLLNVILVGCIFFHVTVSCLYDSWVWLALSLAGLYRQAGWRGLVHFDSRRGRISNVLWCSKQRYSRRFPAHCHLAHGLIPSICWCCGHIMVIIRVCGLTIVAFVEIIMPDHKGLSASEKIHKI